MHKPGRIPKVHLPVSARLQKCEDEALSKTPLLPYYFENLCNLGRLKVHKNAFTQENCRRIGPVFHTLGKTLLERLCCEIQREQLQVGAAQLSLINNSPLHNLCRRMVHFNEINVPE